MYNYHLTKEQKINNERQLSDFKYVSNLNWRFMKKLKSDTGVRAWHIKVNDKHYRLIQNTVSRLGEMLSAYNASKGGSVDDYSKPLFTKNGEDWLHGLEYLLRLLEGEDISKLKLS